MDMVHIPSIFQKQFLHDDVCPSNVARKMVEERKKHKDEEKVLKLKQHLSSALEECVQKKEISAKEAQRIYYENIK